MNSIQIDRTLYYSKPNEKRTEKEMQSYSVLEQLDIPFIRLDHDAVATIEDCEEVDALLELELCKNLFLCNNSKTEFYLLVMPGKKRFKTKELTAQLGSSRLSFANADDMEQYLNLTPGSVTILALMYDSAHKVTLLIDQEIAAAEYIGCHPCVNTSSLKLRTKDVLDKFLSYTGHTPIYVNL